MTPCEIGGCEWGFQGCSGCSNNVRYKQPKEDDELFTEDVKMGEE